MFGWSMRTVHCTLCRAEFEAAPATVAAWLERGDAVLSGHPSGYGERLYAVCEPCQRAPRPARTGWHEQMARLRCRTWELLEWDISLSREQAIQAAVEEEFDPRREPDAGLRAYLLERCLEL